MLFGGRPKGARATGAQGSDSMLFTKRFKAATQVVGQEMA